MEEFLSAVPVRADAEGALVASLDDAELIKEVEVVYRGFVCAKVDMEEARGVSDAVSEVRADAKDMG